ncbi:MAG: MFS transporter [Actinomycetota bacterium]
MREAGPPERPRVLIVTLVAVGLVVAAVGSLGAPLVPAVAAGTHVSLGAAQWTLTITLLGGAVCAPVLGRLGDGPHRRGVILAVLAVVAAGSALTVLPAGFAVLLAALGLQGTGLGLTSLVIAVARDSFSGERARSVIGLLSVTSVAGIGLGYPVAGILADAGGLRAAYGLGAVVTVTALALAAAVLPRRVLPHGVLPSGGPPARSRVDVVSAVLLALALSGLLFALSQAAGGGAGAGPVTGLAAVSAALGVVWVRRELRTGQPLVDLRLTRIPAVLAADAVVLLGGVGMYLLLSLATRYVQVPVSAGYGFGASAAVAGLVLVPFSAMSFLASRTVPALTRGALASRLALPVSCLVVLAALVLFAVARGHLWQILVIMGIAGYGVGAVFSAVPALIVGAVPAAVTSSAISVNQVLRTIGFAAGSALAGLILQAATPAGHAQPRAAGYTAAALAGAAMLAVSAIAVLAAGRAGQITRAGATK